MTERDFERQIADGVFAWNDPACFVVLSQDYFCFRQSDPGFAEKATKSIREGADVKKVFGVLGKSIPLAKMTRVQWIDDSSTLIVRRWSEVYECKLNHQETARDVFSALQQSLKPRSSVSHKQLRVIDAPVPHELMLPLFFGSIAIFAVVCGAIEPDAQPRSSGPGSRFSSLFLKMGALLGPTGSFILAGIAAIACIGSFVRFSKRLPYAKTIEIDKSSPRT